MKGQKKSRRSQRNRDVGAKRESDVKAAVRLLLVLLPLPLALLLTLFPDLSGPNQLSFVPVVLVFALGALIGTIAHIYWIRVLVKEREFYGRFYQDQVAKPHKFDKEMTLKHTRILLPFYIFGLLMFIIILFIFGMFGLDMAYLLPLSLGALEGVPISFNLIKSGSVST